MATKRTGPPAFKATVRNDVMTMQMTDATISGGIEHCFMMMTHCPEKRVALLASLAKTHAEMIEWESEKAAKDG